MPLGSTFFSLLGRLLIIEREQGSFLDDIVIRLSLKENLDIDFNGNMKVYTGFSKKLHFKVKVPPKMVDFEKENRI